MLTKCKKRKIIVFMIIILMVFITLFDRNMIPANAAKRTKNSVELQIGKKKVTKKTYQMKQDEKKKLKVTASKKVVSVKYRSSKKSVATVSKKGEIYAKKAGTTKITVAVTTKQSRKSVWMKIKVVSPKKNKKPVTTKNPNPVSTAPLKTEPPMTPIITEPPIIEPIITPVVTIAPTTESTITPIITEAPTTEPTIIPMITEAPITEPTIIPVITELPTTEPMITPMVTVEPTITPIVTIIPTVSPTLAPSGKEKILIAYFTRSGNTEKIADMIQNKTGGTKFKIETVKTYPEDYSGVLAEASKEKEENARPELKTKVDNMENYDIIFVGYPIWHGDTPMAIKTFLESYDFTGKKLIPFCTSGSSSPQTSFNSVKESASGAEVLEGFWTRGSNVSNARNGVNQWIDRLEIMDGNKMEETNESKINITIGDTVFTATLADNSSANALKEMLLQEPLIIDMHDYGNMEKVGPIGTSLPTNDEHITTGPGDIILYQGNSMVIYYDTNTWNFTCLGKIDNVTQAELLEAMGSGDVTATVTIVN